MAQNTGLIPLGQIKTFRVTGRIYNSKKRFVLEYSSMHQALSVNLWNGSVWAVMESGKKMLIKRTVN
jgi:hypothetical protein